MSFLHRVNAQKLYRRITTHTAGVWTADLALKLLQSRMHIETSSQVPALDLTTVKSAFKSANKRLMMFDYDGTLTPIVKTPSMAVPSALLLSTLERLAEDPNNLIYIISGRDAEFLMLHLGHIKNLGFSAEHGGFLKEPNTDKWINLTEGIDMSWRADVEDIFRCKSFSFSYIGLVTHCAIYRLRS